VALDDEMVGKAESLSCALGGEIRLVHSLQSPPHLPGEPVSPKARHAAQEQARAAVASVADRNGVPYNLLHFLAEPLPTGILELAQSAGADVLVMGSAGRPRFQYSVASTASIVLEQTSCDLLVVKAPGFVSPLLVTEG
jgi:nucleotide-binding universal stress UspA family protein